MPTDVDAKVAPIICEDDVDVVGMDCEKVAPIICEDDVDIVGMVIVDVPPVALVEEEVF